MAMTTCKECSKEISNKAMKCTHCGVRLRKPRRGPIGFIAKWLFILFNIFMIMWAWVAITSISDLYQSSEGGAEQAGTAVGGTIGLTMLMVFWVLGVIVLGAFTYFTKPRD
jgi:hypothetical protein